MLGDLGCSCSRRGAVKPAVIVVVTLVVVVGAIFIKGMAGAVAAFAAEERGREEITAVAQELSADGALTVGFGGGANLSGKLAIADWGTGEIQYTFESEIPFDLRATGSADLGVLLLVDRQKVKVGTYVDEVTGETTGDAYRWVWDARLVDVASKAIVARQDFVGKEPPATTSLDWNWGAEPAEEAVAWAIGLMR
ncbi:MAG: hypothetical protein HRU13_08100 [Phycisphaerales bacterium]|nr:hypothetical protein [Phycisphaerales bacterium]